MGGMSIRALSTRIARTLGEWKERKGVILNVQAVYSSRMFTYVFAIDEEGSRLVCSIQFSEDLSCLSNFWEGWYDGGTSLFRDNSLFRYRHQYSKYAAGGCLPIGCRWRYCLQRKYISPFRNFQSWLRLFVSRCARSDIGITIMAKQQITVHKAKRKRPLL